MTINHGFIWIMDLIEVVYRIDGLETLSPGWCRHGEAIHLVTETLERNVRGGGGWGDKRQYSPGVPWSAEHPPYTDQSGALRQFGDTVTSVNTVTSLHCPALTNLSH